MPRMRIACAIATVDSPPSRAWHADDREKLNPAAGHLVIDLPDLPALSAALADRRFLAASAIAALSGFVRGFSGFGSALI